LETVNPWDSSVVYFTSTAPASQNTYNGTVTVNAWSVFGGSYLYLVGTNALANATINLVGDNDATTGRFGSSALLLGSGTSAEGPGYATIGALTGSGSFALQNTKTAQAGSSLGAGVTLTIGNNNASTTYNGLMSGSGGIVKIGNGTLTATSAWRFWKWVPLNDRDYLGLPVFTISSGNSAHDQWSQEIRYSGKISPKLSGVVGLFGLWQDLKSDPVQTEEAGSAQWRFAQSTTSELWKTPGLFDNFGIRTTNRIKSTSLAVFAQADWAITDKLHVLPGVRYNYDKKVVDYKRETYGGLQTTDPALLALKKLVYTDQAFNTNYDQGNFSGQLSVQYKASSRFNAYATYSIGYKPIGVNVGGLPTANGAVLLDLANVKPEHVDHKELGIKTRPTANSVLNLTLFRSDINDYQTQVQTPEPGVNRGYLANAEKVRVQGVEVDGNIRFSNLSFNAAVAYTDGKYVTFKNAPVPLEEVGGEQAFKDISGGRLPGISKWSGSVGGEGTVKGTFLGLKGNYFLGIDVFARSEFSSNPSPSKYLNIGGYSLTNGRLGFRASNGISFFVWARNVFNKDYYELLLAAPGSYGQYAGVVGDQRTYGVTLRYSF